MREVTEWTQYHLTPLGWVRGDSQRWGGPVVAMPKPTATVMTVTYRESSPGSGPINCQSEVTWCPDETKANELVRDHGTAPETL
jgi:hypothetical protein